METPKPTDVLQNSDLMTTYYAAEMRRYSDPVNGLTRIECKNGYAYGLWISDTQNPELSDFQTLAATVGFGGLVPTVVRQGDHVMIAKKKRETGEVENRIVVASLSVQEMDGEYYIGSQEGISCITHNINAGLRAHRQKYSEPPDSQ